MATFANLVREWLQFVFDELGGRWLRRQRCIRGIRANSIPFLEPEEVYVRGLKVPVLPHAELLAVAKNDLKANTPFDSHHNQVLLLGVPGHDGTCYGIVPKSTFNNFLSDKQNLRFIERFGLCIKHDDQVHFVDGRQLSSLTRKNVRFNLRPMLAAALLASVIGTFVHLHLKLSEVENQVGLQLQEARANAKKATELKFARDEKLKPIMALAQFDKNYVSLTEIWEQLTRAIDDDTWLADIDLKDSELRIAGFSKSPARIVPALERASLFSEPKFLATISNAHSSGGSRVSLSMQVVAKK